MVNYKQAFLATALAGSAALTGCATNGQPGQPRVNETVHVPAVAKTEVKISRCEDNGVLVVDANPYNLRQFQQRNSRWIRNKEISSEMLYTAEGPKMLYYAAPISQSGGAGAAIGGIGGYAAGGKSTLGKLGGAILGAVVLGPIIDWGTSQVSHQFKRASLIELEECRSDLRAIHGAANQGYQQPANGNQRRPEPTAPYSPYTVPGRF